MLDKKELINSAFSDFPAVENSAIEVFDPTDEALARIHNEYKLIMHEAVWYEAPDVIGKCIDDGPVERYEVNYDCDHISDLGCYTLGPLDHKYNWQSLLDKYAVSSITTLRDIISNCNNGDTGERFYKAESESQLVIYAYCADIYNLPKEYIWQFIRRDKSEEET
jgi:hypothetical protein